MTRYLAVDDDPAFLAVLASTMTQMGYPAPDTAASGSEALAKLTARSQAIDAILLDIQMPEMDGIETCRRIRRLPNCADIPIMMVTTLRRREYVEDAFAAGAIDYLTKPLDRIELKARLGMLERLVTTRREAAAAQAGRAILETVGWLKFQFEDAVDLPDCSSVIGMQTLENYLLALHRLQMFSCSFVGFRILGAASRFAEMDRLGYLDYLSEVGEAIASGMKRDRFKLAHAGSGAFVTVLDRRQDPDIAEIVTETNFAISQSAAVFAALNVPLPQVIAGPPVGATLFTRSTPLDLMRRAVAATATGSLGSPTRNLAVAD